LRTMAGGMTRKQRKYLKLLKNGSWVGGVGYTAGQHPVHGNKLFLKLSWNNGKV